MYENFTYFVAHPPPAHDTAHRANQWYPIACNNVIGNDFDWATSPEYSSWSDGEFTWEIPVKWKVGDDGPENQMANRWDQVFHLFDDGTMTVTKFSHAVTRRVNELYGVVQPDP